MKRLFFAALFAMAAIACGNELVEPEAEDLLALYVGNTQVDTLVMTVGESVLLRAENQHGFRPVVTWRALHPAVATVSNVGRVDAVSAGTTTVTASQSAFVFANVTVVVN